MTTLTATNVHPIGVENCPDGGDDLDLVVAKLFADKKLVRQLNLSSVNSINWCRVMMQAVHYFYAYYRVVRSVGENVVFSVPSGAFGNSFAGFLAQSMGLPVEKFVCANNRNQALHTAISTGIFAKKDLIQTVSSAIDICVPYNFWRFLYFASDCNSDRIKHWMLEFEKTGHIELDQKTLATIQDSFISTSVSDTQTNETIRAAFNQQNSYLLDPHTAVAVNAAQNLSGKFSSETKVICLATAHPAKFPEIMQNALGITGDMPPQARHHSLEQASRVCQHLRLCDIENLEYALIDAMTAQSEKH